MKYYYKFFLCLLLIRFLNINSSFAQPILQKKVTLSLTKQTTSFALRSMEKQADFIFSYSNEILNEDSLVSIQIKNKPILEVLQYLFGEKYTYRQHNHHLIISLATAQNSYEVRGFVLDKESGKPVPFATVYEKKLLVATMADETGAFHIKLKKKGLSDSLSVSRISYRDTTLAISWEQSNKQIIPLTLENKELDSVYISMIKNRDGLLKTILPFRQVMNSLNLSNFFARQPFQFSLLPRLGTHGNISSQIINKFSFNILGGFNGGVNGLEIGGLYNITNKNAKYLQVAGLFNLVGGEAKGVQIAGLFSKDSTVSGVQVSGIFNKTNLVKGLQISGITNITKTTNGMQAAGIFNKTLTAKGFQLAGLFNKNNYFSGFQIATVNLNKRFKGVQIGVVNIIDTLDGVSIGLLNIGKPAINKLSVSYDEMGMMSVAHKSGNPKFYNILKVGSRLSYLEKAFSAGYGFGKQVRLNKSFSLHPELMSLYYYNGNLRNQNIGARLGLNFQVDFTKSFSIFAGPSVQVLYSKHSNVPNGYTTDLSYGNKKFTIVPKLSGWFGWSIGMNFF